MKFFRDVFILTFALFTGGYLWIILIGFMDSESATAISALYFFFWFFVVFAVNKKEKREEREKRSIDRQSKEKPLSREMTRRERKIQKKINKLERKF